MKRQLCAYVALSIVGIMFGIVFGGPLEQEGRSAIDTKTVMDAFRSYEARFRRARITFTVDHQDWIMDTQALLETPFPPPRRDDTRRWVETNWDRMRRLDTQSISSKDPREEPGSLMRAESFDGTEHRELAVVKGEKLGFASSKKNPPGGGAYYTTTGSQSLADCLAEAREEDVKISAVSHNGQEMISVEWNKKGERWRAVIDPGRELMPVLVEVRREYPDSVREKRKFEMNITQCVVEEFRDTPNGPVPSRTSRETFILLQDGSKIPLVKERVQVEEFAPDPKGIDPSLFKLEFPAGTVVSLQDVDASFTVGGEPRDTDKKIEEAFRIEKAAPPTAETTTQPSGAQPSAARDGGSGPDAQQVQLRHQGSRKSLWLTLLGIGGVVLLVLWWRARRRSEAI